MAERATLAHRNTGLDLLRALAIVLTFFVHFLWIVGGWQYGRNFEYLAVRDANGFIEGALIWLYHSQHGVFLFFVLSGFLMGKKWFADQPPALGDYLRDRAWRTLPGAWLAITAAVALMATINTLPPDALLRWLENLVFGNWFRKADTHHLLIVTWSLQAEWLFYLSLPIIAIISRALGGPRWISVALFALAVCAALKFLSVRGAAYALFFAAGTIAAIEQARLRNVIGKLPWWFILLSYAAVNFTYAWLSPTAANAQTKLWNAFDTHAVIFALTATALLLKAADAAFVDAAWVRAGRYIGKISYSIYLWHLLVLLAMGAWLGWPAALSTKPTLVTGSIYTVVAIAATWLASALSFRWIEQPYFARRAREQRLQAP
jgi:exopolysaccharide production protein ExoZ